MAQQLPDDYRPNPYFGEDWHVPATEGAKRVPTPVGQKCLFCEEAIKAGERGWLMNYYGHGGWSTQPCHRECQFRQVMGGLAHQQGVCSCQGGKPEDDPAKDMTLREEAVAVWEYVQRHGMARP